MLESHNCNDFVVLGVSLIWASSYSGRDLEFKKAPFWKFIARYWPFLQV